MELRAGSSPALAARGGSMGYGGGWGDIAAAGKITVQPQRQRKERDAHPGNALYFPQFHTTDRTEQHHGDTGEL